MTNELQSLSVLFQNLLFHILEYQRGYAWKHEQCMPIIMLDWVIAD